jgi:hypothetical protein
MLYIVSGIVLIILIISVVIYKLYTNNKSTKNDAPNKNLTISKDEIKDKIKNLIKGNGLQIKEDNVNCVSDIILNTKFNINNQILNEILQVGGILPSQYQDGLMSSIIILSDELDKKGCYIFNFDKDTLNKIVDTKIYNVNKIFDKMISYTGFAFVMMYELIEKCNEIELDNLLNKSKTIKIFYNLLQQCKNDEPKPHFSDTTTIKPETTYTPTTYIPKYTPIDINKPPPGIFVENSSAIPAVKEGQQWPSGRGVCPESVLITPICTPGKGKPWITNNTQLINGGGIKCINNAGTGGWSDCVNATGSY